MTKPMRGSPLWHPSSVNVPLLRALIARAPSWHAAAACKGRDPAMFHPELFGRQVQNPLASHAVRMAKHLCATCPVRRECLEDELAYEDVHGPQPGIRGGALSTERREAVGTIETRAGTILEAMEDQAKRYGLKGAA